MILRGEPYQCSPFFIAYFIFYILSSIAFLGLI